MTAARLDHIHGLRAVAALMVVIQHAMQVAQVHGSALFDPVLETVNLGRFGVVLFFLISGFVIPFSLKGERPLRTFAIGRFWRLYPAYWLSIPFIAAIGFANAGSTDIPRSLAAMNPGYVLANMTMVQNLMAVPNIGLGYWTLNCEIVFYFACALLFATGRLSSVPTIATIVLLSLALAVFPYVSAGLGGPTGFRFNFPYYLALFLAGLLLRRAFVDGCAEAGVWLRRLILPLAVTGAVLSGLVWPVVENANPYLRPLPLALGMIGPLPLFVLVLRHPPRSPGWLLAIGTVSYSLYLFQDLALLSLPMAMPPGQTPVLYVLAVCTMSLGIATLVYHGVEKPAMRIGKRLTGRVPNRETALAAP